MDTTARPVGDDLDLDELMLRVRDAAMNGSAGSGRAQPQAAGEAAAPELDLIRVLEAQGDWNEHARQSMAALVECIRMLRDDWADAQARLRREIEELSALVTELRTGPAAASLTGNQPNETVKRGRGQSGSTRRRSPRRSTKERRRRS